jgi:hypothetical protein
MGCNEYAQSGNENNEILTSIYRLYYFEKKNLKIKKIVCGCNWRGFSIFLTGLILK